MENVNSRCFVDFRRPYWSTKTVHQYGVSIKVRETFRQITQKLWAKRPETWTNCLKISLLKHFIVLASSTGRFAIHFFVA